MTTEKNIVLVGMPSCGKSATGAQLASRTNRMIIDTDQKIVEKIKMPISDYFAKEGEPAFRKVETEVIGEVSKLKGKVIATGGGAILNPQNIEMLKKNGIIFFINRSLEHLLVTSDRPLSSSKERVKELYEQRFELYRTRCDYEINGDVPVKDVAEAILKIMEGLD